jgi:hypothetical protein
MLFTRLRRHSYHRPRSGRSTYAVALPASSPPNWIPCASGNSVEKLIVFV